MAGGQKRRKIKEQWMKHRKNNRRKPKAQQRQEKERSDTIKNWRMEEKKNRKRNNGVDRAIHKTTHDQTNTHSASLAHTGKGLMESEDICLSS